MIGGRGTCFCPEQLARLMLSHWRGIHPASLFLGSKRTCLKFDRMMLKKQQIGCSQGKKEQLKAFGISSQIGINVPISCKKLMFFLTMCVVVVVNSLEIRNTHHSTLLLALLFGKFKTLSSGNWYLCQVSDNLQRQKFLHNMGTLRQNCPVHFVLDGIQSSF